jgi:hypothetical protein
MYPQCTQIYEVKKNAHLYRYSQYVKTVKVYTSKSVP